MAKLVPVGQAAENALTTWLTSQFAGTGIAVWNEWPDPDIDIPPGGAVCLISVGGCQEDPLPAPVVLQQTAATGSPPRVTYTFRTHECEQALQLDVWATSKPLRSDIIERVSRALTASKRDTLAAWIAAGNASSDQDATEASITLQLDAPWSHLLAAYEFDAPEYGDEPDAVKRREYRATYRGSAFFDRTVDRTVAPLASLKIKALVHEGPSPTSPPALQEIATITATSVSRTRGT